MSLAVGPGVQRPRLIGQSWGMGSGISHQWHRGEGSDTHEWVGSSERRALNLAKAISAGTVSVTALSLKTANHFEVLETPGTGVASPQTLRFTG